MAASIEEAKAALAEAKDHAFAMQRSLNVDHPRCFAARQALARLIREIENQQED